MAPTICSEKNFTIRRNRLRDTTNNSISSFKQLNSNAGNLSLSKRLKRIRKYKGFTNKFTQINLPENNSLSLTTSSNESINNDNSIHSQSSFQSTATSISTKMKSSKKLTPTFLLEQIYNENSNKINYCNEQLSLSSDLINQTKNFNNNLIKNNNNENINQFINNIYNINDEQTFSSEDNEVKMILQDKCNFETIKLSSRIKYQRNQRIYMENEKQKRNSFGLVEIALKTIKLIRRNQVLQRRLQQLQLETNQFIRSVMANPENQNIYNNQKQNNNN